MTATLVFAYAAGVATPMIGALLVKLRAKIERRNWFRMTFGPGKDDRKLGHLDVATYALVHPFQFVCIVIGLPKWSPFHEEPKPRPSIDAAELFPKLNIPEGKP